MIKQINIFIFTFAFILLSGCTDKKQPLSQKPVLKSHNQEMTTEEFSKKLATRLSKFDALLAKDPAQIAQSKLFIEREFLIQTIIKKFAEENNIIVQKTETDSEINKMRAAFPDDYLFRQELSKQGVSLFSLQNDVTQKLLEAKVFKEITKSAPVPTEAQIQKYYNENLDRYSYKDKILLKQIVLSTEAAADKIQKTLSDKKSSFEKLAESFSIGPEGKEKGGLVGWVEKGTLEVFDKAFNLPLNTISQTYESPYGFHIFMVLNKVTAGQKALTEVKNQIISSLQSKQEQELYEKWLGQQLSSIKFFKDSKLIDSLGVETRTTE